MKFTKFAQFYKSTKFNQLASALSLLLVFGFFAIFGLIGLSHRAWADDNNEMTTYMTVSPMNQQIILTPGETYRGSIKISNSASSRLPLKYTISIGSFAEHGDTDSPDDYGVIDTQVVSHYNQMMDWIKVDPESGEIQPNDIQIINYTIDVPQDAPAGGQYATLLVQNDTNSDEGNGNVNIQSKFQVASIIYAEVTGETRNDGEIISNEIPHFLTSGPLRASSMVQNNGNVHTNASYTLQVWPLGSDEEICTNEEDNTQFPVLPETRKYHVETCNLGVVGVYRAKQTVKIFGETSEVEGIVILCPIWLMLIIVVIIAAIIGYFIYRARNRRKKHNNLGKQKA